MAPWKPLLTPGVDLRALPLTAEEGFVASRLDGTTDVHGLILLTGLMPDKLDAALARLTELGAVQPPLTPSVGPTGRAPSTSLGENGEADPDALEPAEEDTETSAAGPAPEDSPTHRKLYETTLHGLPVDVRCAGASTCEEPELSAFCFDPVPAVIQALLENPRFALPQARLVAAHHRNPVGLEALAARAAFTQDGAVRRGLLRNPQLPPGLLRRLYANRRLLEQHKLALSREVPEQTRRTARELMRARFSTAAAADEKLELILKTEARCLAMLVGLPVDGKTASLLCARPYASTTLVQNLARWSAAPPALISHLLRQDLVRRSPTLRQLLQRHPNARSGPGA